MDRIYGFSFQLYLGLVASLGVVVTMASVPALPSISVYFSCTPSLAGWTVTSAMLGALLSQFFWGPFSDRYAYVATIFFACFLAIFSSALCYFAPDIDTVIVGRFFQGFSSGAGPIVIRALCRDIYSGRYLSRMIAWVLTVIPFSAGVVPSLSDFLVNRYGWNAPFLFIAFYALCLLLLLRFMLGPVKIKPKPSVEAVLQSYRRFFSSSETVILGLFSSTIFLCFFVFIPSSPWVFCQFFDLDGWQTSVALFFFPFGTFCGGLFQSVLGWRFKIQKVFILSLGVSLSALALNFLLLFWWPSIFFYLGFVMFFGGAMSIVNALLMSRAMQQHPQRYSGNLSSFLGVGQTIGSILGSSLASFMSSPFVVLSTMFLAISAAIVFASSYSFYCRPKQARKELAFSSFLRCVLTSD